MAQLLRLSRGLDTVPIFRPTLGPTTQDRAPLTIKVTADLLIRAGSAVTTVASLGTMPMNVHANQLLSIECKL